MISGCPPIWARKARYYEDRRLTERLFPAPTPKRPKVAVAAPDDWNSAPLPASRGGSEGASGAHPVDDPANGGIRREPELAEHEDIAPEPPTPSPEFEFGEDEADADAVRARSLRAAARGLARQAALIQATVSISEPTDADKAYLPLAARSGDEARRLCAAQARAAGPSSKPPSHRSCRQMAPRGWKGRWAAGSTG